MNLLMKKQSTFGVNNPCAELLKQLPTHEQYRSVIVSGGGVLTLTPEAASRIAPNTLYTIEERQGDQSFVSEGLIAYTRRYNGEQVRVFFKKG